MCFAPQRRALFRHFFDIRTSKSGPRPSVFNTFDFKMCFAPQRRALFRHLNFQKCSENGVFCTFSLRNVLRATTACTFSTSQLPKAVRHWGVLYILTWKCASRHNGVHFFDISIQLPKVVRHWGVLYILTWKCASRHNGVQLFISHLASCLRTRRFSEPTFRPTGGATNHWKNTVFRDSPSFSRICIFFLLILSLLALLTSAFQLSILSEVSLLNFLRSSPYLYRHAGYIDKIERIASLANPTSLRRNFQKKYHDIPLLQEDFTIFFYTPVKQHNYGTSTNFMSIISQGKPGETPYRWAHECHPPKWSNTQFLGRCLVWGRHFYRVTHHILIYRYV